MSASIEDLSRLVQPKSDQLNADDLLPGSITVNITNVRLSGSNEQPIIVDIDGGWKPYKPCKSMSRLLMFCWGKDGRSWIGRSMTLYNDPTVKWAGVEVGGIRISHLSNIDKQISVALTVTRGKRKPYTVEPLKLPEYPQEEFDKNFKAWQKAIKDKKMTAQELIGKVQQKGLLSADMKAAIIDCEPKPETENDASDIGDIPDL